MSGSQRCKMFGKNTQKELEDVLLKLYSVRFVNAYRNPMSRRNALKQIKANTKKLINKEPFVKPKELSLLKKLAKLIQCHSKNNSRSSSTTNKSTTSTRSSNSNTKLAQSSRSKGRALKKI